MSASAEPAWLEALVRSNSAFEQTIPLIVIPASEPKAVCVTLRLAWQPTAEPAPTSEPVTFHFDKTVDVRTRELLHAELQIAAVAAAMAWQRPWESAHWVVGEVPVAQEAAAEDTAAEAVLGVGLIATASNVVFPSDTTLIASLYPDGSLGSVSQITKRIAAAAAAGIKRVILANSQRFEVSSSGAVLNVGDFAQAHHIECLFVDYLAEATERVLRRRLPSPPEIHGSPRYEGSLFNYLDLQCKKELATLQAAVPDWPRKPDQLAALDPSRRDSWKEVFGNYEAGLDAYRAGLLYVTRGRLHAANAQLKVIAAGNAPKGKFDYQAENARATALRQIIAAQLDHPAMDHDELQSALVLAEEGDWLDEINARVEGSQILARQAFGFRSHADARQKELAQTLLQNAIVEAEYRLQQLDYYPSIEQVIRRQQPGRVPGRAAVLLSQLTPAFLAAAELLNQGLKPHANKYREALLFDRRLVTHERVLRDARAEWETETKRRTRQQAKAQQTKAPPPTVKVGFVPGPAYAPPPPPVPPPPPQSLSATARALTWVNKYCEAAALDEKYLGTGGVFEPSSLEWKNQRHAALQNMLQNAEVSARRGIALAAQAGADPSILILIYERASYLRANGEDEDRLEALRHYWRGALLGNLCWQLASSVKADGAERGPLKTPSAPAPQPREAPPVSVKAVPVALPPSSSLPTNAMAPPSSISAIPLTAEELDQLETSTP